MAYENSAEPDQTVLQDNLIRVHTACHSTENFETSALKAKFGQKKYGMKCLKFYCAFDISQEVIFCLALYKEEVNLQIFS